MDKYIREQMPKEISKLGKENGLLDKKMLESDAYCKQLDKLCQLYDTQMDEIASRTGLNKLDIENYYYNADSKGGFLGTGLSIGSARRAKDNIVNVIKANKANKRKPTDNLAGR